MKPGARAFDENLLRLAFENIRADSRVWDIGANVGVFTFAAAGLARAGHVLAVEADVWLSQLIRRSARLHENRSMRIDVLTAAIAQQNGVSSFNIAQRGRSSNYLDEAGGRTEAGGVRTRVCVPTLTLDTLLQRFSAPTLVKIDVEGAEALVMRGARRLLEEFRPIFYIEVGSDSSDEISNTFAEHRYDLYDGERLRAGQAPLRRCSFNTLAVPQ